MRTKNGLIAGKLGILTLFLVSVSMIDGNGNGKDDRIETIFENPTYNESGNMTCAFMGYGSNETERHQCKSDLIECLNHDSYEACTTSKYNQTLF